LLVRVSSFGRKLEFLIRLYEEILCSSRVTAEIVVVIYLGLVDPLPCRNDVLLCGPQISMSGANVDHWLLCEDRSTAAQDKSQSSSDKHVFLDDHDDFSHE